MCDDTKKLEAVATHGHSTSLYLYIRLIKLVTCKTLDFDKKKCTSYFSIGGSTYEYLPLFS
jgi:hypothetical protein